MSDYEQRACEWCGDVRLVRSWPRSEGFVCSDCRAEAAGEPVSEEAEE